MLFVVCCFFSLRNQLFRKNSFGNTNRVSNRLDPDQARHFVGPDLGPNCLQRLSVDDTSRQRVNMVRVNEKYMLTDIYTMRMSLSKISTICIYKNKISF